jgi:cardiolipin synthase
LFRLDQVIAAAAREMLWLTDAYFAGFPPYVAALQAAARDGVDVRLLVPGASDIPALQPITRAGYRPLLAAGVRVFEWNGPMLHAKTAVADTRWSRVGSSNLNVASWLGNYELDAVIEDKAFARAMQRMYVDDLANATEIVLADGRSRGAPTRPRPARAGGSTSRVAAGAVRLTNAVNAVITARRTITVPDTRVLVPAALLMAVLALTFIWWPEVIAIPLAILLAWTSSTLLVAARRHRPRTRRSVDTVRRSRNVAAAPVRQRSRPTTNPKPQLVDSQPANLGLQRRRRHPEASGGPVRSGDAALGRLQRVLNQLCFVRSQRRTER